MKHAIFFALVISLILPTGLLAKDRSVLLLSNADKKYSDVISQNIINNFADSDIRIKTASSPDEASINEYDLIVTIGSQLARDTLEKTPATTPVFSLLIPEQTTRQLKPGNNRLWAAQVIDQPFKRQLLLIKFLIGADKKTGVILGPSSSIHKNEIQQAAIATGMTVNYETIKSSEQLIPALKKIIENNDVVLAVPDHDVYSKTTIRGILLLTYRNRIPVIGFSKSYIKAGATAGIYSTPEQISQDASNNIKSFFENGGKFTNKIYYQDSFSMDINRRVAVTMQLRNHNNDAIIKLIKTE